MAQERIPPQEYETLLESQGLEERRKHSGHQEERGFGNGNTGGSVSRILKERMRVDDFKTPFAERFSNLLPNPTEVLREGVSHSQYGLDS